ncbi:unnamed protein product [Closterium sp. Yama58-4]|nr:unnamed protein product [Closterium sp. Yama58-4]
MGFDDETRDDFDAIYAPVGSYGTARMHLSHAVDRNLELIQLDMANAFLNAKLDGPVFMEQPEFYNNGIDRVCMLKKNLYGLKRSPLLW